MSNIGKVGILGAVAYCALAGSVRAAPIEEFGGGAFLSFRDCSAIPTENGCINPVTGFLPPRVYTIDEGGLGLEPDFSASVAGLGSVSGSAKFSGPAALPVLKATSFSTENSRLGSSLYALQTYTWTGDTAIELPLLGTLDFTRTATTDWSDGTSGGGTIFVGIVLFDPSVLFTGDFLNEIRLDGLGRECGDAGVLAAGYYGDASTSSEVDIDIDLTTGCDGNPISIAPGARFGVAMFQQLITTRGGLIDASNTFELTFAPDASPELIEALIEGLEPASVPEPAALALFGLGFAALGLRRRRQPAG